MSDNYYDQFLLAIAELLKHGHYHEVQKKLKSELEMPYIPKQYEDKIIKLYKNVNEKTKLTFDNNKIKQWDLETIRNIIINPFDEEIHLVAFYHLSKQNIRQILPTVRKYLLSDVFRNENKTHLLLVLKEQEVNEEFDVFKTHGKYIINPINIVSFNDEPLTKRIQAILDETIYIDNPSLMQICWYVWENYWYNFYPLLCDLKQVKALVTAITYCAQKMQFDEPNLKQLCQLFHTNKDEVEGIIEKIYQYEVV